jgi:hypothetical protein
MATIQIQLPEPSEYRIIVIEPRSAYHDGQAPGWWAELCITAFGKDGKTVLYTAQRIVKGEIAPYDTQSQAYARALDFISGETGDCFIAMLDALTDN